MKLTRIFEAKPVLTAALAGAAAGLLLAPAPASAAEEVFRLDGTTVRIRTDRYEAVFERGAMTALRNRLTGETYAEPRSEFDRRLAHMPWGLVTTADTSATNRPSALQRIHPWLGTYNPGDAAAFVHSPAAGARVELRRSGRCRATATWKGLCRFRPEQAYPDETLTLEFEVLPGDGDLQIRATARGASPGVVGVGVGFADFRRDLTVIRPVVEGSAFRPDEVPAAARAAGPDAAAAERAKYDAGLRQITAASWPMPWVASLLILEGAKGSVGLWMTDTELRDRALHYWNNADAFDVVLESLNHAPFGPHREAASRTIRLNVHAGNWMQPARAFRDHWAKTFKVRPLEEREPRWLRDIRLLVSSYAPVPAPFAPHTIIWHPQRWKVTPTNGDGGLFPDDIVKGPELYMIKDTYPAIRESGSHSAVYLNIRYMTEGHPWAGKFWDQRILDPFGAQGAATKPTPGSPASFQVNCAYKPWQDLICWWAWETFRRFGIEGFYMDCASGDANTLGGLIGGRNDCQGQVELMRRMKARIPGCFLGCEYLNEVMAQVVDFGLFGKDQWFGGTQGYRETHVHPIAGFLFNPFVHVYNNNYPPCDAFDETIGRTVQGHFADRPAGSVTDYAPPETFLQFQTRLRTQTMLKAAYPDRWEPNVRSYFTDPAGNTYRVFSEIRPEGRMMKIAPDGTESFVYWRIKGRTTAKIEPGLGIEGWIAYDGDTAIGLNPASQYLYIRSPRIQDWEVTHLPDGAFIERLRPYTNGLLVLELGTADGQSRTGTVALTSRHAMKEAITAAGETVLQDLGRDAERHRCRVPATAPGIVVFSAAKPTPLAPAGEGKVADLTRLPFEHFAYHAPSGIRAIIPANRLPRLSPREAALRLHPTDGGLALVDYFLALPAAPASKTLKLRFEGNMTREGNSFTAVAFVNGRPVIAQPIAGMNTRTPCAADLTPWAGQAILLSLGVDQGHLFRAAELLNPRLMIE